MVKTVSFSPYGGDTIKALEARQKALQQTAPELPGVNEMRSPWQGASYLANTLVNTLQQNAAAGQEQQAREGLAQLLAGHATGQPWQSAEIANAYQYDPELGLHLMDQEQAFRLATMKQENWVDMPAPPDAKPGQMWKRNTVTGEIRTAGGQSVTQIGSGETEFQKEGGKILAKSMSELANDAVRSQSDSAKLGQLESFLKQSGGAVTGIKAWAASMGFPVEGADDLAAAQALINSMVPEQREPGSGTMSDADLLLFKQSLPRLINQPGGNKKIIATLKGIMSYRREQGMVAQKVLSGQIPMEKAYEALMAVKSPMLNFPLDVPGLSEGTLDQSRLTPGQLYYFPNGEMRRWNGQDATIETNWAKE